MPLSNPDHIPTVIKLALGFQPKRVLDVGVGIGAYGLLLRQYMDIAHERIEKSSWQTRIEGVEIFEPYRNPVWDYAYDAVRMGDIRRVLPSLGHYDLIVCNDVLEHFPLAEAKELTRGLLAHTDVLIATSPSGDYPQGAWGSNEAETHHCVIRSEDLPGIVCCLPLGITNCFVCTARPEQVFSILSVADTCPAFSEPNPASFWRRLRRRYLQRRWLQNADRAGG